MTVRQQWVFVGIVVLIMGGGLLAATRFLGDESFPVTVESKAPDFRAATVDGAPVTKTIADYKGDVVLLNVWATWCLPCRTEMPSMERLHRDFGGRGLHVVAVSIDKPGFEAEIRAFVKEYGLTFDVLYDPDGGITTTYQTTGVPYSFVIDRSGRIRKTVLGAADWSSQGNRSLIASLLAEGA